MPEPEETSLEGTPKWIVASVCSGIVLMSFVFERALHRLGKDVIQDICIDESLMERWLPCRGASSAAAHHHRSIFSIFGRDGAGSARRRMLQGRPASEHCSNKGQVPLLSLPALEQIHVVFIFVLAITHVVLRAITVLLGLLQMRKWMHWENAIQEEDDSAPKMINQVHTGLVQGTPESRHGHNMDGLEWQFNNYTFNLFYCRWYHWIFVMIFLLLNVTGWHSNFWISLIPLSRSWSTIINKLAYEVATKHTAAAEDEEGGVRMDGMVMSPSDDLFWFRSPRLVLILIRFILFQNAFFFWTLETFGVNSCMMDGLGYSVSRIVICVIVEVLCSYSTLPLYAIVTHMGRFKSAVFADDVAEHIRGATG
ncbi:unnamed protein product [Miscanthus lutarioriparius]|uniref:MLO-like protein n=1 Tax=Miscanthus lutarioriparius TaxID=422564 RepID=A0A811QY47_9POAL|nr:unnamed protein product [Miscanthus lutarioriparius]